MTAPLQLKRVKIADLKPFPGNPKDHDIDAIRASVREHGGQYRDIVTSADGFILAGHGTTEAMRLEGYTEVDVNERPYPHTDPLARKIVLADNHIPQLGAVREDAVAKMLQSLEGDLGGTGYVAQDLSAMLKAMEPKKVVDLDAVPELPANPATKLGDLWTLGLHRLLCADATVPESVARLLGPEKAQMVFTDPPYAIYGSSSGITTSIADDRMVRSFFRDILHLAANAVPLAGHVYVCCDWRSYPAWREMARESSLTPKNLIVWDKGAGGLGSMYAMGYELVAFYSRAGEAKMALSTNKGKASERQVHDSNIWRIARVPGTDREDAAQKPVELIARAIRNSSDKAGLVLDPFAGSGTTVVAAEQEGRRAAMIEIEPGKCDIIVKRWEKLTGGTATVEHEPTTKGGPNG